MTTHEMNSKLHFVNECANTQRGCGVSCAVDTLCEIYYHCVYLRDQAMARVDTGIYKYLNAMCRRRENATNQADMHVIRDIVWDVL